MFWFVHKSEQYLGVYLIGQFFLFIRYICYTHYMLSSFSITCKERALLSVTLLKEEWLSIRSSLCDVQKNAVPCLFGN